MVQRFERLQEWLKMWLNSTSRESLMDSLQPEVPQSLYSSPPTLKKKIKRGISTWCCLCYRPSLLRMKERRNQAWWIRTSRKSFLIQMADVDTRKYRFLLVNVCIVTPNAEKTWAYESPRKQIIVTAVRQLYKIWQSECAHLS